MKIKEDVKDFYRELKYGNIAMITFILCMIAMTVTFVVTQSKMPDDFKQGIYPGILKMTEGLDKRTDSLERDSGSYEKDIDDLRKYFNLEYRKDPENNNMILMKVDPKGAISVR